MDVDVARIESWNLLRWNACRITCVKSQYLAVSGLPYSAFPADSMSRSFSVPTGAAATLYVTQHTGQEMMAITWAIIQTCLLCHDLSMESAILECIQIYQLGFLVFGVVITFIVHCNRCDANHMCLVFPCLSAWLAFALALTGGSL